MLTLIFALWAAYAFSGADLIRRLPAQKPVLAVIAAIYTLRGLVFIPQAALFLSASSVAIPPRHLVFSACSLLIGLIHPSGTLRTWPRL